MNNNNNVSILSFSPNSPIKLGIWSSASVDNPVIGEW